MKVRKVDSKGRITLGKRFANRTVIVEEINETQVRVRLIAKREAWLHDNAEAKKLVLKGIAQAKAGKFAKAPDIDKARQIANGSR